jgi:hypothetical protein
MRIIYKTKFQYLCSEQLWCLETGANRSADMLPLTLYNAKYPVAFTFIIYTNYLLSDYKCMSDILALSRILKYSESVSVKQEFKCSFYCYFLLGNIFLPCI